MKATSKLQIGLVFVCLALFLGVSLLSMTTAPGAHAAPPNMPPAQSTTYPVGSYRQPATLFEGAIYLTAGQGKLVPGADGRVAIRDYADSQDNFSVDNSGNATVRGTLSVTGAQTYSGVTTINNNLTVTGTTALQGATTQSGTLTVNNNETVTGTLAVTGVTTHTGAVTVNNNATITGTLNVTGAQTNSGALTVNNNGTITGTLAVTGAQTNSGEFTVNNNATITGTLNLTGATFTGPIKYGATSSYASGTAITHGFGLTPTVCGLLGASSAITDSVTTISSTTFSLAFSAGTTPTVYWMCGQ